MSEPTVVAVVTIVLIVLPLLWALSGWFSRRSSRAMLRGVGLAPVSYTHLTLPTIYSV